MQSVGLAPGLMMGRMGPVSQRFPSAASGAGTVLVCGRELHLAVGGGLRVVTEHLQKLPDNVPISPTRHTWRTMLDLIVPSILHTHPSPYPPFS